MKVTGTGRSSTWFKGNIFQADSRKRVFFYAVPEKHFLLIMPVIFTMNYWKNEVPGVGHATKAWSEGVSLYSRYLWLALLIAAAAALSITILVMQSLKIRNQLTKFCYFAPLAVTVLFALISCMDIVSTVPNGEPGGTATWGYYGHYEYVPAWGFYIECALLTVVCVISVLGIKGMLTDNSEAVPENNGTSDVTDQLKKYKELLDNGVLTQEEFEIKKKQLLDL